MAAGLAHHLRALGELRAGLRDWMSVSKRRIRGAATDGKGV